MALAITIIHIISCFFLIAVVLLQTGKGADIGAVFGGSSQTIFGSGGAANLLTRLTTWTAVLFMCTSLFLTWWSARSLTVSIADTAPSEPPPLVAPAEPGGEAGKNPAAPAGASGETATAAPAAPGKEAAAPALAEQPAGEAPAAAKADAAAGSPPANAPPAAEGAKSDAAAGTAPASGAAAAAAKAPPASSNGDGAGKAEPQAKAAEPAKPAGEAAAGASP